MTTLIAWFSNLTAREVLQALAGLAMAVFVVEMAAWLAELIVRWRR